MRPILMLVFQTAALPITFLSYLVMGAGSLVTLVGLIAAIFIPFLGALTIWGSGLLLVGIGAGLMFGVHEIAMRIGFPSPTRRRSKL